MPKPQSPPFNPELAKAAAEEPSSVIPLVGSPRIGVDRPTCLQRQSPHRAATGHHVVRHPGGPPGPSGRDRIHPGLHGVEADRPRTPREDLAGNGRQHRTGARRLRIPKALASVSSENDLEAAKSRSRKRCRVSPRIFSETPEAPRALAGVQPAGSTATCDDLVGLHRARRSFRKPRRSRNADSRGRDSSGCRQAARCLCRCAGYAGGHRPGVAPEGWRTDLANGDGHSCQRANVPVLHRRRPPNRHPRPTASASTVAPPKPRF